MTRVGFEPTHISVVEIQVRLKSTALDHCNPLAWLVREKGVRTSAIVSIEKLIVLEIRKFI
jgi:hypothetical protein